MSHNKILFIEKHYLPRWIWIIVAVPTFLFLGIAYIQLVLNQKVGNHPMSDVVLIIMTIFFGILIPMLFLMMRGEIVITEQDIIISLQPLYRKRIRLDQIKGIKQIGLKPIQNFGGWGLRWNGQQFGFIFEGNSGVEINLMNGKSLIISSKNTEVLYKALSQNI